MQELGGPALRVLEISSSETEHHFYECLKMVVIKSPFLVSLSISGGGRESATDDTVQAIATNCPLLKELALNGSNSNLTDLSLSYLASLQQLRDLSLTWGSAVTGAGTRTFLQSIGPHLEVLRFVIHDKEYTDIDEILVSLGRYCPHLWDFSVYSESCLITNVAIAEMVRGCPMLRYISMTVFSDEWDCLDDVVMMALAESCTRIQTVSLGGSNPAKFSDAGLIALSRGCPDLTELDLSHAHTITDAAVLSLAEHCHKFYSVTLSGNGLITSAAVCALLEANPGITSVTLKGCGLLDGEVSQSLVSCCRKLESMFLEGCHDLTDESLVPLLTYCTSLDTLCLRGLEAVSDTVVGTIIEHCKVLRIVYFSDCPLITGRSVASLVHSNSRLTQISIRYCGLREIDATRGLYNLNQEFYGSTTLCCDLSRCSRLKPWVVDQDDTKHADSIYPDLDTDVETGTDPIIIA